MKASRILLFILSVIAALALMCRFFPDRGINVGFRVIRFPSLEYMLSTDDPPERPKELIDRLTVLSSGGDLYVKCNGVIQEPAASDSVRHIVFTMPDNTESVSITCSGSHDVYGIMLDRETGVCVDLLHKHRPPVRVPSAAGPGREDTLHRPVGLI